MYRKEHVVDGAVSKFVEIGDASSSRQSVKWDLNIRFLTACSLVLVISAANHPHHELLASLQQYNTTWVSLLYLCFVLHSSISLLIAFPPIIRLTKQ